MGLLRAPLNRGTEPLKNSQSNCKCLTWKGPPEAHEQSTEKRHTQTWEEHTHTHTHTHTLASGGDWKVLRLVSGGGGRGGPLSTDEKNTATSQLACCAEEQKNGLGPFRNLLWIEWCVKDKNLAVSTHSGFPRIEAWSLSLRESDLAIRGDSIQSRKTEVNWVGTQWRMPFKFWKMWIHINTKNVFWSST